MGHLYELARMVAVLDQMRIETAAKLETPKRWLASRFCWLKHPSCRTIGTIEEEAIRRWCGGEPYPGSEADMFLRGMRYEIKAGLIGDNNGFDANRVRPKQGYDRMIICVFMPTDVRAWVISKCVANDHAQSRTNSQPRIQFCPLRPPSWLPGDGSLDAARAALETGGNQDRTGFLF